MEKGDQPYYSNSDAFFVSSLSFLTNPSHKTAEKDIMDYTAQMLRQIKTNVVYPNST
jgi:hypothetical protein